jgi:hypothetical protein
VTASPDQKLTGDGVTRQENGIKLTGDGVTRPENGVKLTGDGVTKVEKRLVTASPCPRNG